MLPNVNQFSIHVCYETFPYLLDTLLANELTGIAQGRIVSISWFDETVYVIIRHQHGPSLSLTDFTINLINYCWLLWLPDSS